MRTCPNLTNACLKALAQLPALKKLSLNSCRINDGGLLEDLVLFPSLTRLDLNLTEVSFFARRQCSQLLRLKRNAPEKVAPFIAAAKKALISHKENVALENGRRLDVRVHDDDATQDEENEELDQLANAPQMADELATIEAQMNALPDDLPPSNASAEDAEERE